MNCVVNLFCNVVLGVCGDEDRSFGIEDLIVETLRVVLLNVVVEVVIVVLVVVLVVVVVVLGV